MRPAATLPAFAALLVACADLALDPARVPTSMDLAPRDTLLTEGDQARLRVTVFDQDGDPFPHLPSWAPPRWTVSDPEAVTVLPDWRVSALQGGEARLDAELAGLSARVDVRVNPREVRLSAPTVYLVQSTQNPVGDVPLVAGRAALLRVFATGDRTSFYRPRVRADFFLDGAPIHTAWMDPGTDRLPSSVQEGRLDRSFNAVIPGEVLQPGVEMQVEIDPDGVVPAAPGSDTRVPAEGRLRLDVRALPRMHLTLVPVLLAASPNEQVFNWTSGVTPDHRNLRLLRSVHPIGGLDVVVRDAYTSFADLTTENGWGELLREIRALRLSEGNPGHYYGAVVLPEGSRWGGLGYVGYPVSVGRPSSTTLAHEIGHNLGLRHAPCGGAGSPDPAFPYDGGATGVWGYDFFGGSGLGSVVDPEEYRDIMSYCQPRWISDYHFDKALAFRLRTGLPAPAASAAADPERTLLLWGAVGGGDLLLEPAFVLRAPPAVPQRAGPYRVEGFEAGGERLFSVSFAPDEEEHGGASFAFALPYREEWARMTRVTLSGPEGSTSLERREGTRAALFVDAPTGKILAFQRQWQRSPLPAADARVLLSDGLPVEPTGDRR